MPLLLWKIQNRKKFFRRGFERIDAVATLWLLIKAGKIGRILVFQKLLHLFQKQLIHTFCPLRILRTCQASCSSCMMRLFLLWNLLSSRMKSTNSILMEQP